MSRRALLAPEKLCRLLRNEPGVSPSSVTQAVHTDLLGN